jgi:hypothetical protein
MAEIWGLTKREQQKLKVLEKEHPELHNLLVGSAEELERAGIPRMIVTSVIR